MTALLNRRAFVYRAAASAALAQGLALSSAAQRPSADRLSPGGPPANFLASSFPASLLERSLLPADAWHPFPTLRERDAWQALPGALRAALIARGEQVRDTPWEALTAAAFLEYNRNGDRAGYEQPYFHRRQRMCDLVLAECAEAQGRFLDDIANGIWLICDEAFWGLPAHLTLQKDGLGLPDISEPVVDLFAAETASTLAWIVYLMARELDQLSPRIVERVRLEQKRRILDPMLDRDDFWWMGLKSGHAKVNNWNPWILSNCIATTLLFERDPVRRVALIAKSCKSLDVFLSEYSPDGGCEEGPVYWQRSAASYFDCCWLLTSATQSAAKPLSDPFVKKMGHYIVDVHIANRFYVNYGDAHAEDTPTPELMYRFGNAIRDETLASFGVFASKQRGLASNEAVRQALGDGLPSLARALPDVLAVPEILRSSGADALVRSAWYPSLGLMTARRQAGSSKGFFLAAQVSGNGRSHGHNDTGSFIAFVDGDPLFIDVGVEAYTAKTFSPERYSIWTMQSAYHNLPTIGGVMQHDGVSFRASGVQHRDSGSMESLSMDLAGCYPQTAGINRWNRTVSLDRARDAITLSEDFSLLHPQPVMLTFMTPRRPDVSAAGRVVLPGPNGVSVRMSYDASQLKPRIETISLKDEGLRRSWGAVLYRLLLETPERVSAQAWTFVIEREAV